ncbi:MAG TPA: FAA hydrolase family protein [Hellea balneolensis]|uniref:FAA hydrolase family protein n=1 Tax=Hellea balneolensis TaxID=287478 RepID=A0A7V5U105_9PROT|nr:FAA hydrolase family protein [Hellea balneolensis]
MKLASLKHGRDGHLVIVSRDLSRAVDAEVVPTLQAALDDWETIAPLLQEKYDRLNAGKGDYFTFVPEVCAAPIPRGYQWLDGSAYLNHVELVRKARGAEVPESFYSDPLMYQGASDTFIGPMDPIIAVSEDHGIDFEAEVVVITDDVPMAVSKAKAKDHIKLLMLVDDVSLRGLIPNELRKGFGFVNGKASSAFSPVAVTPDELGRAWRGARVHLPLLVDYNEAPFGRANAGVDMTFNFAELIAHAAKTRRLSAGTIIGSGTVSNKDRDGGPGRPVSEGGLGYSCIAEIRMIETILHGKPKTSFMKFGDRVSIEMKDKEGQSIFGRIDHKVEKYKK